MLGLLRTVAIVGYKKRGKTKIVEGLVRELKNRGHQVGTIKHVPEEKFTVDRRGSDTWRHAQAGANPVVCISPGEVAVLRKRRAKLEEILREFSVVDFVVLEGFKGSEIIAKVIVARNESEASELTDDLTIGFIGHGVGKQPVLKLGDFKALANLVEQRATPLVGGLDCGECGFPSCKDFIVAVLKGRVAPDGCRALKGRVSLIVDGRKVPLKSFMQDLIAGVIAGMLSSMKGAEGENIELKVSGHAR